MNRRKGCGIALGVLGLVVVGAILSDPGQAVLDIWRTGAIQDALTETEKKQYEASRDENLQALRTALMLHHDSEGVFPDKDWMTAILPRLATNELTEAEAQKKLIRPGVPGSAYGYRLNKAALGKYKDDMGDGKTVLIYEFDSAGKDEAGDPAERTGAAITLDGAILPARTLGSRTVE